MFVQYPLQMEIEFNWVIVAIFLLHFSLTTTKKETLNSLYGDNQMGICFPPCREKTRLRPDLQWSKKSGQNRISKGEKLREVRAVKAKDVFISRNLWKCKASECFCLSVFQNLQTRRGLFCKFGRDSIDVEPET